MRRLLMKWNVLEGYKNTQLFYDKQNWPGEVSTINLDQSLKKKQSIFFERLIHYDAGMGCTWQFLSK